MLHKYILYEYIAIYFLIAGIKMFVMNCMQYIISIKRQIIVKLLIYRNTNFEIAKRLDRNHRATKKKQIENINKKKSLYNNYLRKL